ncbi:MAG: hypothetical protein WCW25_01010 [Patescibacteria group bacterium]
MGSTSTRGGTRLAPVRDGAFEDATPVEAARGDGGGGENKTRHQKQCQDFLHDFLLLFLPHFRSD